MVAIVHGVPGASIGASDVGGHSGARRGAFFERVVGGACEQWLNLRPEEVHLFHDIANLRHVTGGGLPPIDLGSSNIDHLVLSGAVWLMLDAKGCGAGELRLENGEGCLVHADGRVVPQPWLDDLKGYSRAGAPYRFTEGKRGLPVYVVPDDVSLDNESLTSARALSRGGTILTVSDLKRGDLDDIFPVGQPPADPADVARILARLSQQAA